MPNELLPLVTVITVTLNCEESIARTIESVASQDYENTEYIIIDGKSSDETPSIIRTYSNCISKFITEEDEGIYDAMNKGIRLSSPDSRFVNFLNAGDVFHDSKVVRYIALSANDKYSHIYGNFEQDEKRVKTPEKMNQFVLSTNMVCHQAIFFRTATHRNYLYDTRFKICADYKLLIDLIRRGDHFFKIDKTLVNFDTSGVSHLKRKLLHEEKKTIRKLYMKIYFFYILKKSIRRLL